MSNLGASRSSYTRVELEEDDSGIGNEDFFRQQARAQKIELEQQDEDLDQLHTAVQRLGDMSLQISGELDNQLEMLDELNEETDKTTETLNTITKKTRELVEKSGGVKYFCIIIWLTLLLIFLTYMVIFV